jgi:hypothetical protein
MMAMLSEMNLGYIYRSVRPEGAPEMNELTAVVLGFLNGEDMPEVVNDTTITLISNTNQGTFHRNCTIHHPFNPVLVCVQAASSYTSY